MILNTLFYIIKVPISSLLSQIVDIFIINASATTLIIVGMILLPIAAEGLLKDPYSLVGTLLLIVASCLSAMAGGIVSVLHVGVLLMAVGHMLNIVFETNEVIDILAKVLKIVDL